MKATNATKRRSRGVRWILAIAIVFLGSTARAHDDYLRCHAGSYAYDDDGDSDSDFDSDYYATGPHYESLRGHGSWRWVPGFEVRLWFPYVEASWRPYYYGHWIHTSVGMTWVSHEPWGEIPHHYGRWVYLDHHGWGWVPGIEYSPAWVTWGVVDGYVGWAPCAPAGYRYPRVRYSASFSVWVFVADRHFHGGHVHRHAVSPRKTLSLIKHKKVLPAGRSLDVDLVRKISKKKTRIVRGEPKRSPKRSIELRVPGPEHERVRSAREVAKRKPADKSARIEKRRGKPSKASSGTVVVRDAKKKKGAKAGSKRSERRDTKKKKKKA